MSGYSSEISILSAHKSILNEELDSKRIKKESKSIRKEMSSKSKPAAPNIDPKLLAKVYEIANRGPLPKGNDTTSTKPSAVRPPAPAPPAAPESSQPSEEENQEEETPAPEGSQLDQEIQYLDSLIPFLETLAQELSAGHRPSYNLQGVATSLATSANKIIAYLAQYAPETMRAGPVGFPMTSSPHTGSVKSPRKERTKLPDISETQQRSLFNSIFIATTEPKNYLRVVGFTQKQVIVEPVPATASGELDKSWLAANSLNEPVVKSLPGQRARVTADNGILFRNQKYVKVNKPAPPGLPSPKSTSPGSPRVGKK